MHKEPGVYKDPLPAWNNQNLISLAKHINSRNFMAHVRTSTIAPTASVNCHPFVFKNHLFMHNGSITDFDTKMALLNTKIQNISTSPTNAMAALAKQIKDQGNDVISLVIGEPGFSTPDIIKAAGI